MIALFLTVLFQRKSLKLLPDNSKFYVADKYSQKYDFHF